MKTLIYGIDGGDLEIMKTFDMPFVHKFLDENASIELTEDLFNRGWVEILTGEEGENTRGFYMSPLLDGSHTCKTKFGMSELEDDPDIVPLWELAERKGVRYCIMNVPTTTPAPQTTNGIVIGSAGGGLNKISGVPEILVSDEKTRQFLIDKNYIVDLRIPNDEIAETEQLFRRLKKMEDVRTDCFIELCQKEQVEFGFLANRGTTIAQYLARSEIESYAALNQMDEFMPRGAEKSWVHKHLEEHYTALDNNIRRLYEELKPDHFIITADHNTLPHKHKANVAPFLIENGYLKEKEHKSALMRIKEILKGMGLGARLGKVSQKVAPKLKDSTKEYDWKKSVAFGSTYIPGIFINDRDRFGGPVSSRKDVDDWVARICKSFNAIPAEERCEMTAVPYRANHRSGKHEASLPDIKLKGSEGIFFEERGTSLVWDNPNYGSVPHELEKVSCAAFTGDKGPHPLCLMTTTTSNLVEDEDKRNLTLIYRLIDRILG